MKLMKFQLLFALCSIAIVFSCTQEQELSETQKDYTLQELKSMVESSLERGKTFDWREQDNSVIYSAGMLSDSVFSIGYTVSAEFDIENSIHTIDLSSSEWLKAKNEVEELILSYARLQNPSINMRDLQPQGEVEHFPQIVAHLTNEKLIEALRKHPNVRFVEPIGFSISDFYIADRSSSGCNGDPNYNINSNDYTEVKN